MAFIVHDDGIKILCVLSSEKFPRGRRYNPKVLLVNDRRRVAREDYVEVDGGGPIPT